MFGLFGLGDFLGADRLDQRHLGGALRGVDQGGPTAFSPLVSGPCCGGHMHASRAAARRNLGVRFDFLQRPLSPVA